MYRNHYQPSPSVYKRLIHLEQNVTNSDEIHIRDDQEDVYIKDKFVGEKLYRPSATASAFHKSNAQVRFVMGPYGSGKSTMCCQEIVKKARTAIPCADGVRRMRGGIVRNSYPELETTTVKTWMSWFGNMANARLLKKHPLEYTVTFRDEKGIVEMEILFFSLDKPQDIDKLGSLDVTFLYFNEGRNMPLSLIEHGTTRLGRYPHDHMCNTKPDGHPDKDEGFMLIDSNPPDVDHWIYNMFEVQNIEGYEAFKQPPAVIEDDRYPGGYRMNEVAENITHMSANYYINLIRGKTKEFIKIYAQGDYGAVMDGEVVHAEYNDDVHARENIPIITDLPLLLGWDFGLTPCVLIAQFTKEGQFRALKEICSTRMNLRVFVKLMVNPYFQKHYSDLLQDIDVGDPSGVRPGDAAGYVCFEILQEEGFNTEPAITNDIPPRLDAVDSFLTRMHEGEPSFILDKEGCPNLRKGFLGGYHKKRIGNRDLPVKNQYSHIQDCLQYIALEITGEEKRAVKAPYRPPQPTSVWI